MGGFQYLKTMYNSSMKKILVILLTFVLILTVQAEPFFATISTDKTSKTEVIKHLKTISVVVKSEGAVGTGIVFSRTNTTSGKIENFVWTAAHVVSHARKVMVTPFGEIPRFDMVSVVEEIMDNNETVGIQEYFADILKYSNVETGEDIALLRIQKKGYISDSVVFSTNMADVGTRIYHIGNFHGMEAPNSFSEGFVSKTDTYSNKKLFDQLNISGFQGSSGGGMYTENGKCIGMLTLIHSDTWVYMIPERRIRQWATQEKILWAMDINVPLPSESELSTITVESGK